MEFILEILKITIPALLVFAMAYYVLKTMLNNEERKRYYEMKKENRKQLTPVKLTAYERLALFLERISPESMIIRVNRSGMTAGELHSTLLATVREEFEHNVTQQIYVSEDLWKIVKNAKVSLVQTINTYASQIPSDIPSFELAKAIIEGYNNSGEESPIDIALKILKAEVKSLG